MKRKIPALLLALLLVFSAALPASAAGRACLRSSPASACTRPVSYTHLTLPTIATV